MVISLQQCLTKSYLIKRNSKRFNTKWSWHRTQYPTWAQEDMVHLVSSYLTFQTYSLWLSSGSLTSCMLSKNWDFLPWTTFPQRDIARNRSVPALRLGPGLHTLSPLVFLQHSEGFSSWGSVYSIPDSATNFASQSPTSGFVTRAGSFLLTKCTQERAELSLSL